MKKLVLCLLFCLAAPAAFAQIPGPVPPAEGTWHDFRVRQHQRRLLQPPPMPPGGFWIVEDNRTTHGPMIVRFYLAQGQQIHTDTVFSGHLDIRNRNVVVRLHEQLIRHLNNQPDTYLTTRTQPR